MTTSKTNLQKLANTLTEEDVVKCARHDMMGVVIEVGDEEEPSENDSEDEDALVVGPGCVKIAWTDGTETVEKMEELMLVDRSFLHGDIVAWRDKPFVQSGFVIDANMTVSIMRLDKSGKQVLTKVHCKHLKQIHSFKIGRFGIYEDKHLCRIDDIIFDIVVRFDDGSELIVDKASPDDLIDDMPADDSVPFYPGQVLEFDSDERKEYLMNGRWIKGKYNKKKHKQGIIIKVVPVDLELNTITSKTMEDEQPDDEEIDMSKFQPFQAYSFTGWEITDHAYVAPELFAMGAEQLAAPPTTTTTTTVPSLTDIPVVITFTETMVDVKWQDGTIIKNIPSVQLIAMQHLGDAEFWPEDFVTKKHDDKNQTGVVQTVNAESRTCIVKWVDDKSTEEVSVYDILAHEDYSYRLGDAIILLPDHMPAESTENVQWAGEITGINDEMLTVQWINGTVSQVKYDKVVSINELSDAANDEDEESGEENEDVIAPEIMEAARNGDNEIRFDDNDSDWETVSEGSKGDNNEDSDEDVPVIDQTQNNTTLQIPSDIISRVVDINSDTNQQGEKWIGFKKTSETNNSDYIPETLQEEETEAPLSPLLETPKVEQNNNFAAAATTTTTTTTTTTLPNDEPQPNTTKTSDYDIERFQIVEECTDHLFLSKSNATFNTTFVKTVQKEWKLLQENLPAGIFVFAVENRMDLMRAVIIGPQGTPYYDGMFVFDIFLPSDYPAQPPKLLIWAYGERVNPNLYADGKVCLSLLGTWEGKDKCENWNPKKSNILQLLLSLLGLVLVSEPYYNEAGYMQQIGTEEGKHNSALYNENALLIMLHQASKILQIPPQHSKSLVVKHFLQRGHALVQRITKYLDEKKVERGKDGVDEQGLSQQPSTGFLKSLAAKLDRLKQALAALEQK